VHRTNLHARRVLALLALHRHVEEAFFRNLLRVVVVLRLLEIERTMRELQHANVLNFRSPREVVFLDAGMDTFAATDAAGEIETINKLDPVHRPQIADVRTDAVLALDLALDPLQHFRHFIRVQLLVVLLQEFLGGREVAELAQGRQTRRERRQPGECDGATQKTAARHCLVGRLVRER
jgi:hypothetical protein